MKRIKYGILGCGYHSLIAHAIPSRGSENSELAAICDISEESMKKFEQQYGQELRKFTDREEFYKSGISAVFIGTPDEYHYDNLAEAIEKGMHVFVEKPICTKSSELKGLKALLHVAKRKDLVISSCHPRRCDQPFMWLKENMDKYIERFGRPLEFGFDFSYHKPSKKWKHERGLLLDHMNHEIDLMHFLFGNSGLEAKKLGDAYDRYTVIGKRDDGLTFKFHGTRRLESRTYLEWTHIRFERGDIKLCSTTGNVEVYDHDGNSVERLTISRTDHEERGAETLENFFETINGKKGNYLTQDDLYINTSASVLLTENETWKYDKDN